MAAAVTATDALFTHILFFVDLHGAAPHQVHCHQIRFEDHGVESQLHFHEFSTGRLHHLADLGFFPPQGCWYK